MDFNSEVWSKHQYGVLVSFVHHLAYRALHAAYIDLGRGSEFWKYTLDAHILTAITDWCKVFGADSNDVHWKKTIKDKSAQDKWHSELLRVAGFSESQWAEYWRGIDRLPKQVREPSQYVSSQAQRSRDDCSAPDQLPAMTIRSDLP